MVTQLNRCKETRGGGRESGIELLKVIAIVLIILSHVVQALWDINNFVPYRDYMFDFSKASTSIQSIIIAILQFSGVLGNSIFFFSSCWFLSNSKKTKFNKIVFMYVETWIVSMICLIVVLCAQTGNVAFNLIKVSFMPISCANYWYITCYICFYVIHPYLNVIIDNLDRKSHLLCSIILIIVCFFSNYIVSGAYYYTKIMLWISLYFTFTYLKKYCSNIMNSKKINLSLLLIGLLGIVLAVLIPNAIDLTFSSANISLLYAWQRWYPFETVAAFGLFNLGRMMRFKSETINKISSLSLLIYIIHNNILIRTYLIPYLWHVIYLRWGHDYVLLCSIVMTFMIFVCSTVISMLYRVLFQKYVRRISEFVYEIVHTIYRKIETLLFRLE